MEYDYKGFTAASGPNQTTRSQEQTFAHSSLSASRSPPSPPFSASASVRSARGPAALGRVPSPPSAFETAGRAVSPGYGASPRVLKAEASESRPLAFEDISSVANPPYSSAGVPRPASFSTTMHNQSPSPRSYANFLPHQDQSSVSQNLGSYASVRNSSAGRNGAQVVKRNWSPPLPLEDSHFPPSGPGRGAGSLERMPTPPPSFGNSFPSVASAYLKSPEIPRPSISPSAVDPASEAVANRHASPQALKRTRAPSLLPEKSYSTQDDTEREMQAKAKRLARFKVELSENVQHNPDFKDQKIPASGSDQSIGNQSLELTKDFTNAHGLSDYEASGLPSIISGLCPDMCPASERAERERKGDLDPHERVDGDRNQSSQFLAVKKYNRTAEREASLIRPMPVLQKTIDYLLNLLDQPYDDRFLGMYNFLWDRMRAIRMDLRMQHIFNQGTIVMLEQMIRLHIIAMHELCEHTKGEGFSEGFDAHLNIEQMNKTSVELFQIYDDHRKKGINIPTEREFRGYYALLKLDKHPGYKVEPAELSLDLAKMTPEIRQTPEVLFARDVARSCRTGNFIAFFRLARRASYLQACLMHAHFAKLRTQALASLHSGLQLNQGLPVAHVAMWLGMEEEDIESLLQYHGFSIKIFEEPYMMKEGPFCNRDKDYPTKCSVLVHLKRSSRIVKDVSPSIPAEVVAISSVENESFSNKNDEEMADVQAPLSSINVSQEQPFVISPTVSKQSEKDRRPAVTSATAQGFLFPHPSPKQQLPKAGIAKKPVSRKTIERNTHFRMEEMPLHLVSIKALQERSSDGIYDHAVEKSASPIAVVSGLEDARPSDTHEENKMCEVTPNDHDKEIAEAKLKLILRLWKRRSAKQRKYREQRQVAASAALDSLSLGPPIRQKKDHRSNFGKLDIDHVIGERHKKHVESWSRLNVSDVVVGVLSRRNPEAKCLCWKMIVCSQMSNLEGIKLAQRSQVACLPAAWLHSKLMPSNKNESDDNLIISSPGLSMWRKWISSQYGANLTCCLSVVKDVEFGNLGETVSGASAVLFLVSEDIPWKHQKFQLHNLLMSIPSGSCLPLLILSCSYQEETPDSFSVVVNELGLHDIDKSRISSFKVVSLIVNHQMDRSDGFFCDKQLREGLKWLASESSQQPVLQNVKTRELILSHLNSSLEVLERKNVNEVGPNDCISAFNEALDWSLENIAATAKANPACWPCPENALLEESSDEHRMVKWYLPNIGWNSQENIEPLMCALRESKLPTFTDDISWLGRGSYMGKEIENQKLQLESCLVRYLTEASKMMRFAEAIKEACLMLQKGADLKLQSSCYCIVPRWTKIFRRIFNWRLMNLSSGIYSEAYILECYIAPPISREFEMLGLEGSLPSACDIDHPLLDEVIEVGCSPLLLCEGESRPEACEPLPGMVLHDQDEEATICDGDLAISTEVVGNPGKQMAMGGVPTSEIDNLNKLVERCKMIQSTLDKELSVYF